METKQFDEIKAKLEGLERQSIERGPKLDILQDEVNRLRDRVHEISNLVQPIVIMRPTLALLPQAIEKLNIEISALTSIPGKIDSLNTDFLSFKGRVSGGLFVASIFTPILTGLVTAACIYALHIR